MLFSVLRHSQMNMNKHPTLDSMYALILSYLLLILNAQNTYASPHEPPIIINKAKVDCAKQRGKYLPRTSLILPEEHTMIIRHILVHVYGTPLENKMAYIGFRDKRNRYIDNKN